MGSDQQRVVGGPRFDTPGAFEGRTLLSTVVKPALVCKFSMVEAQRHLSALVDEPCLLSHNAIVYD